MTSGSPKRLKLVLTRIGAGAVSPNLCEQLPEERIGLLFDGVHADGGAVEGETLEAGDGIFQIAERSHEAAVGAAIEKFVGAFGGHGKRERMKLFAVLDELIDVVEHVFVER